MFRQKYSLLGVIYFTCILFAAIYCFKRPLYNWDMLAYSCLVLEMDRYSPGNAHAVTYQLAKDNIPSKQYLSLIDSSNPYRRSVFKDSIVFNDQLAFYVVKPLYTGLVYLEYKAGIPLLQATLIPSFITYLLIGLLFFHWLSIYLRPSITLFISLLIMISSPMIVVAKLATPDCLS